MDVDVAVFPAITRRFFAIAIPSGTIEHGDYYFLGYDSVALKLPFPFASIKAVTSNNHELPVQTEGAYAFIDRIPKGSYTVTFESADFSYSATFVSSGSNKVSVKSAAFDANSVELLQG